MSLRPKPLPEYAAPPVTEVALAVIFRPLEDWHTPHAGLYWSLINKEYPRIEVQPALPWQIENLDEEYAPRGPQVSFQIVNNPDASRSWFLADPATHLIQVQRDRFIVNWRKIRGDEVYPRYTDDMRPRFEREWTRFGKFLRDQKFSTPEIHQCEVTYVNDLPRGEGWEEFPEALELFAHWVTRGSEGFLPPPETLTVAGSLRIPEGRGRMYFSIQHLIRQIDKREVVQLQLSARGKPNSTSDSDLLDWMDSGREWIVRGFTDLTSPKAHNLWRRTQ